MNKIKQTLKLVLLSAALGNGLPSYSQYVVEPEFKWADKITGSGSASVNTQDAIMDIDAWGNVVMANSYTGTIDFDPTAGTEELTSASMASVYIWKADSNGNFMWVKELKYDEMSAQGFPMFNISTLSIDRQNGDIYITGIYGDPGIDFDPGPSVYHMEPFPGWLDLTGMYWPSVFVLKLDEDGDFQWAKSLDLYNGGSIYASVVSSNGNGTGKGLIYIAGASPPLFDLETGEVIGFDFDPGAGTTLMTPANNYDWFNYLFTLDADGDFQWVKQLGVADPESTEPSGMTISKMVTDETGNLYCLGGVGGTLDIDPGEGEYIYTGNGSTAVFALTGEGDLQWIKQGEMGINVADGVEEPSKGGGLYLSYDKSALYIAYALNGKMNVDNTIPFGEEATINAVYGMSADMNFNALAVAKFKTNGDFEWVRQVGGHDMTNRAFIPRIAASKDHVYLTGRFSNNLDLDPSENVHLLTTGNAFIAMYNNDGDFLWGSELVDIMGTSSVEVHPHNIAASFPSVYYTGDWYYGEIDADLTDGEFILIPTDAAQHSTFVNKIALHLVDTTSGLQEFNRIQGNLYPNPTSGMIHISLDREVKSGILSVVNILGQEVLLQHKVKGQELLVDITSLIPGTYFIELREEYRKVVFTVIKQ